MTRAPVVARALALASVLAPVGPPACLVDNPRWDGAASETSGASGETGAGETGGASEHPGCNREPDPPAGMVVNVTLDDAAELDEIAAAAAPGTALVLADGLYSRAGQPPIDLAAAGVQLRSASGNPGAVVLDGGGTATDLVVIRTDDVLIAELTLRGAAENLVRIKPPAGVDLARPRLHRVRLEDAARFGLLIDADFPTDVYADDGEVSCSVFTLGDELRQSLTDCTITGGIKGLGASGWVVRDSQFEEFWCPSGPTFIAVNFSNGSRDTTIERNEFRDDYRGVMLGFEANPAIGQRAAPPGDCPATAQHFGGSIVNNMLWVGDPGLAASTSGVDAMISAWSACGVEIQHNTVVNLLPIFSAIEYRFSDTTGTIANNLLSATVLERDPAAVVVAGNLEQVGLELFVDAGSGDVHVRPDASAVIDAAVAVGGGSPAVDFDGEPRDSTPDVGADELAPSG